MSPSVGTLDSFYRIITQFVPECHAFSGYIFLNIDWSDWLQRYLSYLSYDMKEKSLGILLLMIVKYSFEPKLKENVRMLKILQDSVEYPWHSVEYPSVERVLDWFVSSAEPSIIFKLPSDYIIMDNAVLK